LCTAFVEINWRIIITIIMSMIFGMISIWITALTREEKKYILQSITQIIER
jgi:hypothetical protein